MDELNEQEVETPELPEVEEGAEDTTDWEARAKELEARAIKQREKTKELKAKLAETSKASPPVEQKPNELNDGQKALFVSYGIKSKDEIALGKELMARLQINSVEALIEDDYFQSRLTKLRDAKATQEAVPVNTGRSASTISNRVDYWMTKPFNEVPKELRQEVLNAQLKANEQKQKFGG